jgi:hypothetical protein
MVMAGIPAVVAMQFPISDRAAIAFARKFYPLLAHGDPVDAAVAEGRRAIRLAEARTMEWGTPVLFMRFEDGDILREDIMEGETMSDPEEPRATGVTIGGQAKVQVGGSIVARDQIIFSGSAINVAGRDLFQGAIADKQDLVEQLQKLREDLKKIVEDEDLDREEAMIADAQINAAISNAQKPDPDPDKITQRLKQAKDIIEKATVGAGAAAGLIAAISTAVELVGQFFS